MPKLFRWKGFHKLVIAEDAQSASSHANSKFCFAQTTSSDFEEINEVNYAQVEKDSGKTIISTMNAFKTGSKEFKKPFIVTY